MDFFLHIVRVHITAMLASMCEYWSCALQSKLFRPPEISRCRAFTWIIVVPGNPGSPSEISRFHANGQAFKTEKHMRTGISRWPEISLPPEISLLMWTGFYSSCSITIKLQHTGKSRLIFRVPCYIATGKTILW